MHCWLAPEHRATRYARRLRRCGLIALLLFVAATPTRATETSGFEIREVHTRLENGVYLLDAEADVEFSSDTIEALQSGVPLTIVFEMELMRQRPLMDERIASVSARYKLHMHALSGQFIVTDLATGATRNFRTYPEAIAELGRLRDFPLFDAALLDPNEQYRLRMRARLDIEALPSPMRLLAYFDSLWKLSSGWTYWNLQS